jgi:hypothetical protein
VKWGLADQWLLGYMLGRSAMDKTKYRQNVDQTEWHWQVH